VTHIEVRALSFGLTRESADVLRRIYRCRLRSVKCRLTGGVWFFLLYEVFPDDTCLSTVFLCLSLQVFEAFFLFVVFIPLDLPTAPRNDLRTLGAIGAVFAAALVPLFVINGLVTGSPLKPPRLAGGVPFDVTIPSGEGGSGADAGTGTETPADRAGGGSTETPEATPDQRTPGTDPGSPPTATEPGERTTTATDRGTDRPAADGTANGGPVGDWPRVMLVGVMARRRRGRLFRPQPRRGEQRADGWPVR